MRGGKDESYMTATAVLLDEVPELADVVHVGVYLIAAEVMGA